MPLRLLRFRLRTLLIFAAVVASYFGSWPWFKERAIDDVRSFQGDPMVANVTTPSVVVPFVISRDEMRIPTSGAILSLHRGYYLWVLGFVARLPYDRPIPPVDLPGPRIVGGEGEFYPIASPPTR